MKLKELKYCNIFRFMDDLDRVHELDRLLIEDEYPVLSRYYSINESKYYPITKADLERDVMFLKDHWSKGQPDFTMKLYDLKVGTLFKFVDEKKTATYEYRGNGWYGTPEGYDGGPWHDVTNPEVRRP